MRSTSKKITTVAQANVKDENTPVKDLLGAVTSQTQNQQRLASPIVPNKKALGRIVPPKDEEDDE